MPTELTDREKCMIVQMMLRQSPKLKSYPRQVLESIQLFYKEQVYPDLTPQDIGLINNDMDKFLHEAESTMQKALLGSVGKKAFSSIMDKFNIGKKEGGKELDSQEVLKRMEAEMRKEIDENDGT